MENEKWILQKLEENNLLFKKVGEEYIPYTKDQVILELLKANKQMENIISNIKKYVSEENINNLIENAESHLAAKAIDEVLTEIQYMLDKWEVK